MKTLLSTFLLAVLVLGSVSCKTGNKASSETKPDPKPALTQNVVNDTLPRWITLNRDEATKAQAVFTVGISFISFGAGTDPEARQILEDCLDRFEAKSKLKLHGLIIPWGREGEADFCLDLSAFDPAKQTQLIEDLKIAFKGKELVQIQESFKNRFKP